MTEAAVLHMLGVDTRDLARARAALPSGPRFHFVKQSGRLAPEDYEYGTPFMARRRIDAVWSKWYGVEVVPGGIHEFQDGAVLRRR
jgi:hypothetical protein